MQRSPTTVCAMSLVCRGAAVTSAPPNAALITCVWDESHSKHLGESIFRNFERGRRVRDVAELDVLCLSSVSVCGELRPPRFLV
jgi:hypothetical protein